MIIINANEKKSIIRYNRDKRLVAYCTALNNNYKFDVKEFEAKWKRFEDIQAICKRHSIEQKRDFYVEYLVNEIDQICQHEIEGKIEDQDEIQSVLQKVINVIEKESEYETKIYSILKKQSEKHPLVSWVIMEVLLAILITLLGDIVCDGINASYEEQAQKVIECLQDEGINTILLNEEGDSFIIIGDVE